MNEETPKSQNVQTIKLEPALELLNALQKALMLVWQEASNHNFITTTVTLKGQTEKDLSCQFVIGVQALEAKK